MNLAVDILKYEETLRIGGFKENDVHVLARATADLMDSNLASKVDLAKVDSSLRTDLAKVEASLKSELAKVEASLKSDIAKVEASLKSDIALIQNNIKWIMIGGSILGTFITLSITAMLTILLKR